MTRAGTGIRPIQGPRWTRKRLIAMLVDCYGPTPRGGVDVDEGDIAMVAVCATSLLAKAPSVCTALAG